MPFDHDVLANVEATLDALSDPTPEEAYDALLPYETPMVASAAARRALSGGGGGGSSPFDGSDKWASFVGVVSIPTGPATPEFNFTTDAGITARGASLLDTTTPDLPAFVAEGIYAVTFTCGPDSGSAAGKKCTMSVIMAFVDAGNPLSYQSFLLDSGEGGTLGWVGITNYVEAGTVLQCRINHDVGSDTDFDVNVYVQQLA